jgi:hypothetical protein
MNTEQLTMLLARIQVLDNRQVDQLTIEAWSPLLANITYSDAVTAVNEHFTESTDYLQPAHIVGRVRAKRRAALPQTMSETAPDDCGNHRRLADGTCMYCTHREEP